MPLFGPPDIEKLKAKGDIRGLIKAGKNNKQREKVVEALGQIGAPAVEPLIAALTRKNRWGGVAAGAAQALGEIGDPRAVEPLIGTLVGDKRCFAVGPAMSGFDTWLSVIAATALGKIGDPRAVEPLVATLQAQTREMYEMCDAAIRLCEDGAWFRFSVDKTAQGERLLAEAPHLCKAAADALDRLGWKPDNAETGAAFWAARFEWDECVKIGPPAVQSLIAVLWSGKRRMRSESAGAAQALGEIGDPRAVEPLIATLGLGAAPTQAAAEALGKFRDPRAARRLSDVRSMDFVYGDRELADIARVTAVRALGNIGNARAVGYLIDILESKHPYGWDDVREAAVDELGKIGDPRAAEAIGKARARAETECSYCGRTTLTKPQFVNELARFGIAVDPDDLDHYTSSGVAGSFDAYDSTNSGVAGILEAYEAATAKAEAKYNEVQGARAFKCQGCGMVSCMEHLRTGYATHPNGAKECNKCRGEFAEV
jgi:HEAT repeat protein